MAVEIDAKRVTAPQWAWVAVGFFLDHQLSRAGWSQADVAMAAEVSQPTVKRLRNAEASTYYLDKVFVVLRAVGMPYEAVIPFLRGQLPEKIEQHYRTAPLPPKPITAGLAAVFFEGWPVPESDFPIPAHLLEQIDVPADVEESVPAAGDVVSVAGLSTDSRAVVQQLIEQLRHLETKEQ